MGFRWIVPLGLWFSLWLPSVAGAECGLTRVATVPMQVAHNRLLVDAKIDGKPATLMVDTGATLTMLSYAFLDRLGSGRGGEFGSAVEGIGGVRATEKVVVNRIDLGTMHSNRVSVEGVNSTFGHENWDGVLGMDFLSTYDLDIDTVGRRLIFYTWHGGCGQPTVALTGNLNVVKMLPTGVERTTSTDGQGIDITQSIRLSPVVWVSIGGRQVKALLDTGSPSSALYRNTASRLGISLGAASHGYKTFGIGPAAVTSRVTTLPEIDVGDLSFSNVPVEVLDQAADDDGEDMILGLDFIQTMHPWISHSSSNVIFQYPPARSPAP